MAKNKLDDNVDYIEREEILDNVIVVKVNQSYMEDMSDLELYDITRGCWKVSKQRADTIKYAFSTVDSIVVEVYEIFAWLPGGELNRETQKVFDGDYSRWGFEGRVAPSCIRNKFIGRSTRHLKISYGSFFYVDKYIAENSVDVSKLLWEDLHKREQQPLSDDMVQSGILKEAQFIFYSEGGAMGNGGDIATVQKNGDVYQGNYIYGGLSIELIIKAFPYIGAKKFDEIVDSGISKDGKVHYYYLEGGNHLFVRDTVDAAFHEVMCTRNGSDDIYNGYWYDIACIVCPDKYRNEMLRRAKRFCDDIGMRYPDGYPGTITDRELDEWIHQWDDFG
jgi:hypothetical protein